METFKDQLTLNPDSYKITDSRILFDINAIRKTNKELLTKILDEPLVMLPELEDEILANNFYFSLSNSQNLQNNLKKNLGFYGSFGRNKTTPRNLNSALIGKMISIKGIITRTSKIRPKIQKSVHYKSLNSNLNYDILNNEIKNLSQNSTKKFYEKDYRDSLSISKLNPTTTMEPVSLDGNMLSLEQGMSTYKDFQSVTLQELPELTSSGTVPISVEVILENDLVDKVKPGDRVEIIGVVKSSAINSSNFSNINGLEGLRIKYSIIANNLQNENIEKDSENFDEKNFSFLIKNNLLNKEIIKRLHFCIAPSIYGNESIKKSILLQLISINSKNRDAADPKDANSLRTRSTINILLIGDPSTAKSQFLRYILKTIPISVSTTGRGSSGVGLTASIIKNDDVNDKILAAGALVIADGGICCIDEFDKMDLRDRVSLHEAMEQQTVTVNKAGIHATLNSRTAIVAAANPVYGVYQMSKSVSENLGVEKSLVTRFDLVWILRDKRDREFDSKVADFVLNLNNTESDNLIRSKSFEKENFSQENFTQSQNGNTAKITQSQNGNSSNTAENSSIDKKSVVNYFYQNITESERQNILKLHIEKAQAVKVKLSKLAAKILVDYYVILRQNSNFVDKKTKSNKHKYLKYTVSQFEGEEKEIVMPVTPRVLESLVRMAVCNAKLYFREIVGEEDAEEAIRLYKYSINNSVINSVNTEFEDTQNEYLEEVEKKDEISKLNSIKASELLNKVKVILLEFKDDGAHYVNFSDICAKLEDYNVNEIENVLKHLDEEDIIMFSNETVLFLD